MRQTQEETVEAAYPTTQGHMQFARPVHKLDTPTPNCVCVCVYLGMCMCMCVNWACELGMGLGMDV